MDQEIKQVHVWVTLYYGILVPTKDELPPEVDGYFEQLYAAEYRPTEGLASYLGYGEHDLPQMLCDTIGTPHSCFIDRDYVRSIDRNGGNPVRGHLVGVRLAEVERDAFNRDIDGMLYSGGVGVFDHRLIDGFDIAQGQQWEQRAREIGIEATCQLHLISSVQFFDIYVETESEEAKYQNPDLWDIVL